MSYLVGNPEDRFFRDAAQILMGQGDDKEALLKNNHKYHHSDVTTKPVMRFLFLICPACTGTETSLSIDISSLEKLEV